MFAVFQPVCNKAIKYGDLNEAKTGDKKHKNWACPYFRGSGPRVLIGFAVRGATLALAVGARAALGATVAAGVVPGLLRPLAVIAVEEQHR